MKSIAELVSIALLSGLLASCASEQRTTVNSDRIVTNPIDLNYRFQPNEESRREAADPVLEYFKGYYYMFASKSGGYWRSEDLAKWEYIPCTTIPTMEDYAPTILVYGDTLYFTASSGNTRIYKNAFGANNPWATFPSISAAWNFTNEKFFNWEPMSTRPQRLLRPEAHSRADGNHGRRNRPRICSCHRRYTSFRRRTQRE